MAEIFEVGPCTNAYDLGFLIGSRFSALIRSRLSGDAVFQTHLLPFSDSPPAQSLIAALSENNRTKYPHYWDELRGTADGSGVSLLHILLINFRKEILPFVAGIHPDTVAIDSLDDCSDVLVVDDTAALAAHNEDADRSLVGHTYIVKAKLSGGGHFTAYTYAGELPSCAFGFNSSGLIFTLNSVPPSGREIVSGGIGRNFVSRDLLEAAGIDDALRRIRSAEVAVGHSYNLLDVKKRRMANVETASRNRMSVREIGSIPFFHANRYVHLEVDQVYDESSAAREARAAALPKKTKEEMLMLLGDTDVEEHPIYMTGPKLQTLCTALVDLDEATLVIIDGDPKHPHPNVSHVFSLL